MEEIALPVDGGTCHFQSEATMCKYIFRWTYFYPSHSWYKNILSSPSVLIFSFKFNHNPYHLLVQRSFSPLNMFEFCLGFFFFLFRIVLVFNCFVAYATNLGGYKTPHLLLCILQCGWTLFSVSQIEIRIPRGLHSFLGAMKENLLPRTFKVLAD